MGQAKKTDAITAEIPEIQALVSDINRRIRRLSEAANVGGEKIAEGSGEVNEFVRATLDDIMARVRETAAEVGAPVAREASRIGGEASRIGSDAAGRIANEVEQRPWVMLAVAVGIGFLAGFASRR